MEKRLLGEPGWKHREQLKTWAVAWRELMVTCSALELGVVLRGHILDICLKAEPRESMDGLGL